MDVTVLTDTLALLGKNTHINVFKYQLNMK